MKIRINHNSFLKSKRKLNFCPEHFTKTSIKADRDQMLWVFENTNNRFAVYSPEKATDEEKMDFLLAFENRLQLAFEDPQEAMLCELKWS